MEPMLRELMEKYIDGILKTERLNDLGNTVERFKPFVKSKEDLSKDSCLTCPKLWQDCNIFRAQYERNKAQVQDERYEEEKRKAEAKREAPDNKRKAAMDTRQLPGIT
jgi:hypothetical protein